MSDKTKYITCGSRVGPAFKYKEVRKYISDVVLERWTSCDPISKLQMKDMISFLVMMTSRMRFWIIPIISTNR